MLLWLFFFLFICMEYIFHLLNICVSLDLKWVTSRLYMTCFCIHSASQCSLIKVFDSFTFKIVMDSYILIAILLIVFLLFVVLLFLFVSFSLFILFHCDMIIFSIMFAFPSFMCVCLLHVFGLYSPFKVIFWHHVLNLFVV